MSEEKKSGIGFTGNQLKIFALICMTLDHVGLLLLPNVRVLRYIGRLAMPIFAWMIAEGCRYTKNKGRHLLIMAFVAILCQAVYWVVDGDLMQSILVTFSLSTILIYALDYAMKKKSVLPCCLLGLVFAAIVYICLFLPKQLPGFSVDYDFFGVMLPVIIYIGKTKEEKLLGASCCMAGIAVSVGLGMMQWFSFLSLPILYLYNGERGKAKLKYLFYIYYPLHLAALYGIAMLLINT